MAAPTGYLYGDSSPARLEIDFIAFLRDAFDFAVEVLLCDGRLGDAEQRAAKIAETTEREIARAEGFVAEMSRALDRVAVGDPDSLAARCAAKTRQGAKEIVRVEVEGARAAVAAERAQVMRAKANDREACGKALETLLLHHVLPDAVTLTQVRLERGTRYEAELHGCTPYGLEWVVALEIPPSHLLSHVLRIDRVVERLEIEAPEEAGWIRKEVKVRAQRFDRLHLTELTVDSAETTIKLRAQPDGSGAGFDMTVSRDPASPPSVKLLRVLEGGTVSDTAYVPIGADLAKLQSLHDSLATISNQLTEHKKSLISASLDDKPVAELERPRSLVDRLIANIAPTVQEIAKRSLTPSELVIKRLLGGSHREEVFVSKAELEQKVASLPEALRHAFDPLKLWDSVASSLGPEPALAKSDRPPVVGPPRVSSDVPPPLSKAPPKEQVAQKPLSKEARTSEPVVGGTPSTVATATAPTGPPPIPQTLPPPMPTLTPAAPEQPSRGTLPPPQAPPSRPPRA